MKNKWNKVFKNGPTSTNFTWSIFEYFLPSVIFHRLDGSFLITNEANHNYKFNKKTYKNTLLLAPNMCCNPFDKTISSKSLANLPLLLKRAWEIKRNQWYEMG